MSLFRRIGKLPVEVPILKTPSHPAFRAIGTYEETIWYADNKEYAKELTICLSAQEWTEFVNQEFYQDMIEYLRKKKIEVRQLSNEGKKMNKKKMERLYALLERAEREKDTETAAALRWAIFTLENGE